MLQAARNSVARLCEKNVSEMRSPNPGRTKRPRAAGGATCVGAASLFGKGCTPGFTLGFWGVGSTESDSAGRRLVARQKVAASSEQRRSRVCESDIDLSCRIS